MEVALIASNWASTAARVGSSTHSRRRSTAKGRMMRPNSDCLKSPRSVSAIFQMSVARFCWFMASLWVQSAGDCAGKSVLGWAWCLLACGRRFARAEIAHGTGTECRCSGSPLAVALVGGFKSWSTGHRGGVSVGSLVVAAHSVLQQGCGCRRLIGHRRCGVDMGASGIVGADFEGIRCIA